MKDFYCDLHIHIGATSKGAPVKITASKALIFESIVKESLKRKGMDMICIVDSASPGVISDIRNMVSKGEIYQMPEGGFLHRERLAVLLGSEVETAQEDGGLSHHISIFPDLKSISEFSRIMSRYITNMELSSQRARLDAGGLYDVTKATGGVLVPAHVFTPHKSIYGNAGRRLKEVFKREDDAIYAVELGLSADSSFGDHLTELEDVSFLSNSDAHSIAKIAREYNLIRMERPSFKELILALKRRSGRKIVENTGMDPRLGRYHRSFCKKCGKVVDLPPPALICNRCGASGRDLVKGVYDRIIEIADYEESQPPSHRPPYRYQIPLMFIPGMNARYLSHLLSVFGSEMAILNKVSDGELKKHLPPDIARSLIDARSGKMGLSSGGGGFHGRIKNREAAYDQLSLFE